jgi:Ca2+-binding RTX toxin-like protein
MRFSTIDISERLYTSGLTLETFFIASFDKERVVLRDAATGARLIYEGEGLTVRNSEIVRGTIDDVSVETRGGKPVLAFTDANVDVREIRGGDQIAFFGAVFESVLLKPNKFNGSELSDTLSLGNGRDIIRGFGGDDSLDGGAGNDVVRGGGGADTFNFNAGTGVDVIADFDARGGDGLQDRIGADFFDAASISQVGKNTVVDFGDGDKFILRGVQAEQIDASDFTSFAL